MKNIFIILVISFIGCKSSDMLIEENNNGVLYSDMLYPVKYDKLWGYADFRGNTLIEPQFEEATLFRYGLAVVKQNNMYGYISNAGNWVIKPKYQSAELFFTKYIEIKNEDETVEKGLIAKVDEGNGYFYIYPNGKAVKQVIISSEIGGCVQTLPRVKDYSIKNDDGSYELTYEYFVHSNGTIFKRVFDTTHIKIDTIIELSPHKALLKKDGKYAIYLTDISKGVDVLNNKRISISVDSVYNVDLAFIYEDVKFWGVDGEMRPESIYKKDGKWGMVNVPGKPIIPFVYEDIVKKEIFGNYLVEFEKGRFGYLSLINDSQNRSKYIVVEHFKRSRKY